MTDEQFLETLTANQRFFWERMLVKYGSIEAVRQHQSNSAKKKTTKTGFHNPDTLEKAIATRTKNRG